MRYDLKTPCKNCPFRSDDTGIRFRCRSRAEEIEELAYREGFPCHLSAEFVDDDETPDGESGGYYPGENTQHCIGYIIMQLAEAMGAWPGIDNDEDLYEKLAEQVDYSAPVFGSTEDFLAANEGDARSPAKTHA